MLSRLSSPSIQHAIDAMIVAAEEVTTYPLDRLHETHLSASLPRELHELLSPMVRKLIEDISAPDDYVQAVPNIRVHSPGGIHAVNYHSDHLFGHSESETNYWISLTPAFDTNTLWMCDDMHTQRLHALLRNGATMEEFESAAAEHAKPVKTETPGIFTFCCAQIHGSLPNTTNRTRVSFDMRTIPASATASVKRKGGYFRPKWLRLSSCPVSSGTHATTVATLDVATPVYLQRQAMKAFYPQSGNRELVEFVGLNRHAPTLEDAASRGPVVAYSIRQVKRPLALTHAVGFADERLWVQPGEGDLLSRLVRECA